MAVAMNNGPALCEQCGQSFSIIRPGGQPKRFCSNVCRQTAKDRRRGKRALNRQGHPCEAPGCLRVSRTLGLCLKHYQRKRAGIPFKVACGHCGAETERQKYCSVRCSQLAHARSLGVSERAYLILRPCAVCGKGFKPKHNPNAGLCCSRECGFTFMRWRGEQARAYSQARDELRRWASRPKRALKMKRERDGRIAKATIIAAIVKYVVNPLRPCLDCSVPLGRTDRRADYCAVCITKRNKATNKRGKRIYKAWRRSIERGVNAERFDPIAVFERDKWRCHLCGCKTPKRLRGSYDDTAPELDHIIPLSKGGEHSRANTACACRKCNGAKGDTIMGQLSLLAIAA
jgi:5-methylcytosine-specific restriction endonuclease McrA